VICSVLQCAAVCSSVLQSVAACCSVLQCVAVCCSVLHALQYVAMCCPVLQWFVSGDKNNVCVLQCIGVGLHCVYN